MGEFRVRDNNPLLTSKPFNYTFFKQAALIMTDSTLTKSAKDDLLKDLKSQARPNNYVSPA